MRCVLWLFVLFELVGFTSAADQPVPSGQAKQDVLKQLEGVWVLKSASVSTPEGVGMAKLDGPNTPKMGVTIKGGVLDMMSDGKPIPNGRSTLALGSEPECLYMIGKPDQKPFKVRFKLDGDRLVIVQDMLFQETCPESFDPEKGRDRGRRVLTLSREPLKPFPSGQAKQHVLKQLEGNWLLKSASVSTPQGVGMAKLDAPNTPKMGAVIKNGVLDMMSDGKPIPNGRSTLALGSEPECLYMIGKPDQKPFKVRFKLEGDTLVIIQDMLFREACPESFDPEKGRDRGRRVLTLSREPLKPFPSGQAKQHVLKQLEGNWLLKSASVSTPQGVGMANLNDPNTPKMEFKIKDGVMDMMTDGKPIPNGRSTLELGSEPECLNMIGKPGEKPFKARFKLEGNTLVMAQDGLFQETCPESFDPEKGRDRGRRVLTLSREPLKP